MNHKDHGAHKEFVRHEDQRLFAIFVSFVVLLDQR